MTNLFGQKELRALSWKEPFATLMLHEKIETRTWATNYRGLVLICASKQPYNRRQLQSITGWDKWGFAIISHINSITNQDFSKTLGRAIAIGELIDCRLMQHEDKDKCYVAYSPVLYCHIYKNVRAIKPFSFKGQLGWKKMPIEFIDQVEFVAKPTKKQ